MHDWCIKTDAAAGRGVDWLTRAEDRRSRDLPALRRRRAHLRRDPRRRHASARSSPTMFAAPRRHPAAPRGRRPSGDRRSARRDPSSAAGFDALNALQASLPRTHTSKHARRAASRATEERATRRRFPAFANPRNAGGGRAAPAAREEGRVSTRGRARPPDESCSCYVHGIGAWPTPCRRRRARSTTCWRHGACRRARTLARVPARSSRSHEFVNALRRPTSAMSSTRSTVWS